MAAFKIDKKSAQQLEKILKTLSKKAIPFATKDTLNQLAFEAMRQGRSGVKKSMTIRNKWTQGSIRAKPTRSKRIDTQVSFMGSMEDYMRKQEKGGMKRAKGPHGLSIPTSWAAGQEGAKPRTKLIRKPRKMSNIKLRKFNVKTQGKTRKQILVRTVQEAVKTNRRNVFLELGTNTKVTRSGLFRVIGGSKGVKRGWPGNAKLKMIHDISRQSVRIPRHMWMKPAAMRAASKSGRMYKKALRFQINRARTAAR